MKFRVYFLTRWLRNLTKSFSRRNVRRFIAKELCTSSTLVVCTTMMILQALYLTTDTIPKRVVTLRDHNEALTAECMEVHIAVPSNGNYQRQRLPILIKSILLYSRHIILHLHMITDNINKKRIQILLSTWKLPQVVPHYYEADEFLSNPNSLVEMAGYFMRNKHMLPGVNKMILTKSDVYFISDIAVLWYNLEVILLDEMIAVLESHSSSPQKSPSDGVLLLNLEETLQFLSSLKPQCHNAALLFTKDHMFEHPQLSVKTREVIGWCRIF